MMVECDGIYWPDSCNEECFGAMWVGKWKERAKWNEIIYRRGGIVQGGDGEEEEAIRVVGLGRRESV